MSFDPAPEVKANWVLEKMGIFDTPALHLDEIAASQKIKIGRRPLPNDMDFSGALLFRGDKRAILLNTAIPNAGRQNFTLAHELGHYFLRHKPDFQQSGEMGFRCSPKDMKDTHRPQEIAANRFAAELLMPASQFRPMMSGAPLDYTLINHLARYFVVSKHACGSRILEFTRDACIIIRTRSFVITGKNESLAARRRLLPLTHVPIGSAAYSAIQNKENQIAFSEANPVLWLARVNPTIQLYECTRGSWENGVATTILKW